MIAGSRAKGGLSLYDASVPVYLRGLRGLAGALEDASAFAARSGLDPVELLRAPIVEGFLAAGLQAEAACAHADRDLGRVLGVEPRSRPAVEMTFAILSALTVDTIAALERIDRGRLDRAAATTLVEGTEAMTGFDYILHHSIPHFYFHLTAMNLILRHHGVEAGDPDFLWAA